MMLRLQRAFASQFARPRGPFGQLAARFMRQGNAPFNHWIVELLSVNADDRILEVGFGPGVALTELLQRAPNGFVAGVDASTSMANQARARHRQAIADGRVQVTTGDASALPFDDAAFDKVCGTHVVYFWSDPVATIGELRRVLRPGGVLALGYQERERMPPRAAQGLAAAGAKLVDPGEVEDLVRKAGFSDVRVESKPGDAGPAGFCVLATK